MVDRRQIVAQVGAILAYLIDDFLDGKQFSMLIYDVHYELTLLYSTESFSLYRR